MAKTFLFKFFSKCFPCKLFVFEIHVVQEDKGRLEFVFHGLKVGHFILIRKTSIQICFAFLLKSVRLFLSHSRIFHKCLWSLLSSKILSSIFFQIQDTMIPEIKSDS